MFDGGDVSILASLRKAGISMLVWVRLFNVLKGFFMKIQPLLVCLFLCIPPAVVMAVPAFPGAEGYGAAATGGRGGAVYIVTNLDDSGLGSLRDALNHNTPRTIVFQVSGTIHLESDLDVRYPNVTIAGQTAPGDGICIANGSLKAGYDNVIIRYIRCRLGDQWPDGTDNNDTDATWGRYANTMIFDHVTASWSVDEAFSYYANQNFTAQWCLISESLRYSHHEKGAHGYGGIWGGTDSSWHHNLLAHHSSRNPRIEGDVVNNVDLRNNVIYNWGFNSCYGGEKATVNIVNCYYKYGPATGSGVRDRIVNPSYDDSGTYGQWYVSGNYVYGYSSTTSDNWLGVDPQGGSGDRSLCQATTPFPVATTYPVSTQTAQEAYYSVLDDVGCSLIRDAVDSRIIEEVRTGTATYGGQTGEGLGIIDSQTTVGGWPALNSLPALSDYDSDGMPDVWEDSRGLNFNNPADRNDDRDDDGYTNLEEYLNWLCTPAARADTDRNCIIDIGDFAVLAASWQTQSGDAGWNKYCDIARPANGVVDITDLMVLVENWLGQSVQDPGQEPGPSSHEVLLYADVSCRTSLNDGSVSQADENNSDSSKLSVRGDEKAAKSWIKFDLNGLELGTITAATLRITLYEPKTSTCLLSAVNDDYTTNISWTEGSLTWNNAPGNYTSSDGINADQAGITQDQLQKEVDPAKTSFIDTVDYSYGGAVGDQFFFDVLSILQDDTDGIVQFVLHGAGGSSNFATHDNSLGQEYWPALEISYSD